MAIVNMSEGRKPFSPKKDEQKTGNLENNSGQGPNTPILDIVSKKFNWGACLLTWIWGLGNKSYITLLVFLVSMIPFVGIIACFGCQIWFGIKGNEWAWQNKRWNGIEHFHNVQKKWATAGIVLCIVGTIVSILFYTLFFMAMIDPMKSMNSTNSLDTLKTTSDISRVYEISINEHDARLRSQKRSAVYTLYSATKMMEALDEKCDYTSEGLAACFAKRLYIDSPVGTDFETKTGVMYSFSGDGACTNLGDCSVLATSKEGLSLNIPLYLENGYVKIQNDIDKE